MPFKDLVPLIVVALGAPLGFLSAFLATRLSRGDFLGRRELEFRERQLAEFYGPLYGYLHSQVELVDLWLEGKLHEKNHEIKQLFLRQHMTVRELIVSKAHLIDSSSMPDFFTRFMTSTIVWDMYAAASPDGRVPDEIRSDLRIKYPTEFNEHIFATTVRLKKRIEDLHTRFAIVLDTPVAQPPRIQPQRA
jgi:hypothetical protein